MKKQLIATTAAAALIGLTMMAAAPAEAAKEGMEKCYGVVKAGQNQCGGAHNSCAGTSTEDGAEDAWVYVPTGLCDKLVHGSTSAPAEESIESIDSTETE